MAQWVRQALDHSGLTQARLAELLTQKLGRAFDRAAVNKMALMRPTSKNKPRAVKADELYAISEITGFPAPAEAAHITHVPLLSWVSAGALKEPTSQIPIHDVPLLAFADLGRGDYFALKVEGDSMDRWSPEGSTIVVNRADRTLVAGKPYVFSLRGETTYKLWQPDDPPYLQPHSINPMHKPMFLRRKRDFEVIGRVKRSVLDL